MEEYTGEVVSATGGMKPYDGDIIPAGAGQRASSDPRRLDAPKTQAVTEDAAEYPSGNPMGDGASDIIAAAGPSKGGSIFENGVKMDAPDVDYAENRRARDRSVSPNSVMFNPARALDDTDAMIAKGQLQAEHKAKAKADKAQARMDSMVMQDVIDPNTGEVLGQAPGYPSDPSKRSPTDVAKDVYTAYLKIAPTAIQSAAQLSSMLTNFASGGAINIGGDTSEAMKNLMEFADKKHGSDQMQIDRAGLNELLTNRDSTSTDLLDYLSDKPMLMADMGITTVGSMFLPIGAVKFASLLSKVPLSARTVNVVENLANSAMNAGDTYEQTEGDVGNKGLAAAIAGIGTFAIGKATGGGTEGMIARRMAGVGGHTEDGLLKTVGKAMGKESLQEGVENTAQSVGQDLGEGKAPDLNNALKQATLGAVVAPLVAGPGGVHEHIAERAEARANSPAGILARAMDENTAGTDFTKSGINSDVVQGMSTPLAPNEIRPGGNPAMAPESLSDKPTPPGSVIQDATGKQTIAPEPSVVSPVAPIAAPVAAMPTTLHAITQFVQSATTTDEAIAKAEQVANAPLQDTAGLTQIHADIASSLAKLEALKNESANGRTDGIQPTGTTSVSDGRNNATTSVDAGTIHAATTQANNGNSAAGGLGESGQQGASGTAGAVAAQLATEKADSRTQPKSGADHVGRNNVPMLEGGKPFKTNKEAKDAQRNNPMMRVLKSPTGKGFILAPKTEKQLAAQKNAAKKLGGVGNSGIPMAAHEAIASAGGLNKSVGADLGIQGNQHVGAKWLFAGEGGLTLEMASEKLKEDGFLKPDASHSDALALIKRSLTVPQYTPEGTERMAAAHQAQTFEDHLQAAQESPEEDPFGPLGIEPEAVEHSDYHAADKETQQQVNALLALHKDNPDIDLDHLKEESTYATDGQSQDAYNAHLKAAIETAVARGGKDRGTDSAESAQPGRSEEESQLPDELTHSTEESARADQGRRDNAASLDDRAQIDKEAEHQTLTQQSAPEQRKDSTGDMFAMEKTEATIEAKNKGGKVAEGPSLFDEPAEQTPVQAERDKAEAQRPTGATPEETQEIGQAFDDVAKPDEDGEVHHLFDAPAKSEIVRLADKVKVYNAEHGWMTVEEAKAKIDEWKAHAEKQGTDPTTRNLNNQKVVLSLFDLTGKWSQPWVDAGYQVYRFDLQTDPENGDVTKFSAESFMDTFGAFEGQDIHAILAGCPCTEFASSGARHFAAKDADGRTHSAVELVHQTLRTIEFFKPAIWSIENPVGRIEKLAGLPPWRLSFDPNQLGDPYTKKTLLWGRFNGDLPIAPVEATEGSKMHSQYGGKSQATKNARSATPEGFAYSFFMANNAIDHPAMTIAGKFDRLDPKLIDAAVKAGVTEAQITEAVEDHYYQDLNDESANEAIKALIDNGGPSDDGAPLPAISEKQARKQLEWRNQGQTGGEKKHSLYFYERENEKGTTSAMHQAEVTLYQGSDGWQVNSEGQKYKALADAKKAAVDVAIARLQDNGYVLSPADHTKAILDANNVKGKERLDVLKDVKDGTHTPEEIQAAYPNKPAPEKGVIGQKLESGQVVLTTSGRETTPFPKVATDTVSKTTATVKKVDAWLMENAHAEAVSRGDNFNARQFEGVKKPTQSDKDSAEEYLFGQQPAVVPSILKPMSGNKVGDMVKLTKPNPAGGKPVNIAGSITKINPDGTLEIRTQQDGYQTRKPSELGHISNEDYAAKNAPAAPAVSAEEAQAHKDMMDALGDLGDLISKPGKSFMAPEQEQKLLPILTRLFDAAFRLGYSKFKDAAKYVLDTITKALGAAFAKDITLNHLQGAYITMSGSRPGAEGIQGAVRVTDKTDIENHTAKNDNQTKDGQDVSSSNPVLERDSAEGGVEPAVGDSVQDGPRGNGQGTGSSRVSDGVPRRTKQRDSGVAPSVSTAAGEQSNLPVHSGYGPDVAAESDARTDDSERSGNDGLTGVPPEHIPAEAVSATATTLADTTRDREAQLKGNKAAVKLGDAASIAATLPTLHPGQQEDVKTAEDRFAKPKGFGMLFTNGTGTGKTFLGLGIIKRMVLQGKDNILIAAPDKKIMADWIASGNVLGLNITALDDTQDAGKGVAITTYANLRENNSLASRKWDMVAADEAHELMQGKDGAVTSSLDNFRAITGHTKGAYTLYTMRNASDIAAQSKLAEDLTELKKSPTKGVEIGKLQAEYDKLTKKLEASREAIKQEVADNQGEKRTRALFLSATPFAYEKTLDWANEYLFDYKEGYPHSETSLGYNTPNPQEHFMVNHLGYRMRYGKLTQPDAKVDRGLMQRSLNGWMRKQGSVASRMLDVEPDYDRRFILTPSAIGTKIDEALEDLDQQAREAQEAANEASKSSKPNEHVDKGASDLRKAILDEFHYLARRYVLEAIKAKEAIPIVQAHLDMGRKVVVFHDYKKGGIDKSPFDLEERHGSAADGASKEVREEQALRNADFNRALSDFKAKYPELIADLNALKSPIDQFMEALPGTSLINGNEKPKDLLARYTKFQSESSEPHAMLVQSAKNKGWSGHDTTGKNQRVLINLGQPTAPTLSIQQEGRIYRTGQASNAIMRYLNTGTNWERWAFATTIAERASEAENLGMGEQARALKDSFINAFNESDDYHPGHEGEGTGGKERDRAANNVLSQWDRAKTNYWSQQKKTSKNKAEEGKDYFATPEPIGLKMAEWLDAHGGEATMEPSAGHGAIARWLPENTKRTAIEPSLALRSRLAMVMDPGSDNLLDGNFEDHNVVNKYDGIAMNPPFGSGGKTAIDHLAKAATHLRDGGRVVALIPTGPAADAKFEKWFHGQADRPAKPLFTDPNHGPIYKGDTLTLSGFGSLKDIVVDKVDGRSDGPRYVRDANTSPNGAVNATAITKVKPTGQRTEQYSPAADLHMIASIELPSHTFERAGTGVMTRIVVIEKQMNPAASKNMAPGKQTDLTDTKDINELFDRMENMDMRPRIQTAEQEQAQAARDAEEAAAAAKEAKKNAPKPAKAEKPAKSTGLQVGDTVTLDKDYKVEIYTTQSTGKEKPGIFVDSKPLAQKYSNSVFFVKGKGFFVGAFWLDKAGVKGDSDFNGSNLARRPAAEVAPVSRDPAKTPLYEAFRQLSRFDETFQTGISHAQDLGDIAKEMTAKMEGVRTFTADNKATAMQRDKRVNTIALRVEGDDGVSHKLLDIFDATTDRPYVVIGNSDVGQDVGGSTAYQIAFAWAHNNGKTMRPDPAGLTVINRLRRSEAMISSALHFGTTEHLEPHRDQYVALMKTSIDGKEEPSGTTEHSHPEVFKELEALKTALWHSGTDAPTIASNVNALVTASSQLAVQREPQIRAFEVADGVLRLRADKQSSIPLATIAADDSAGEVRILGFNLRPGTSGVGSTTLKRAAVSFSVQRAIERAKLDAGRGEQVAGNRSPSGLALDAIRQTLGKLDSGTPEALKGTQYARGEKSTGMAVAAAQSAIDKLTANHDNGPAVHVVESTKDLPVDAPSDAKGMYHKGQVWIVAENNSSAKEVASTYAHEAIAHYGLRNMLGVTDWKALMAHIQLAVKSGNKPLAAISKSIRATYVDAQGRFNLTEGQESDEIAARVVENAIDADGNFRPGFGFMKSIFAKVMAFLRSKGITIQFSHAELQGILIASMQNMEAGQRTQGGGSMAVAHSLLTDYTPEEIKQKQDAEAAALKQEQEDQRTQPMSQRKVTADQIDLFNPQESLFSIGTSKFKKWFGDSKVVDADGKPMVVYHGTNANFTEFSQEHFGDGNGNSDWGDGFYFASNPKAASSYASTDGGNVMPVYLDIRNPANSKVLLSKEVQDNMQDSMGGDATKDVLESMGYDGIIIDHGADGKEYVVFRPEQIKSATGNNGDYDPSNPDVAFSRKKIAGETTRQYTPDQLRAMDNVGFRTDEPTLGERIAKWTDRLGMRLKQGIVDQFAPIEELSHKAYALMRQSKGASGAFESFLHGGLLKLTDGVYDFDDQNKGGVIDRLLTPLGGEHHDFMRWVAANRAERLLGAGKENLFTQQDINDLKTLAQGTTTFDYTLQHGAQAGTVTRDRAAIYADSLKTFNVFMKNALDMAEQSGLIDPESRQVWEHEFYVPFYRVADDDGGVRGANVKGGVVRQEAFKTLKGGKNALNADLLDNTLMNWAHLLDAGAKNRAAQESIAAAEAVGIATRVMSGTKKSVWVMVKGEKQHYTVSDPMVMEAISALEYAGMKNPVMNAMSTMKHALTMGVTASPFFKVRNLIRDSVQAIAVSGLSGNVAANVVNGWKLSSPKSDSHFRMLAGGGTIHFGTMYEGSEAKRVQALVESGVDRSSILLNQNAVKAFYRKVIEPTMTAYNELGNRGEEINRASLYDQLRKQGVGHGEASLQARDLMDFSMQGSFATVRFLTQVVPFMNARLQGLYKLGKGAKEDPVKFALVLGAVAALSLGLLAAYRDDDDWKKREEWDRNNFWWFKVGGKAFRIPKPFEIGAIATLAERGFERAFDKEMTNKRFMAQVMALAGDNLSMNPIPQLVKPMLDVYSNTDSFTGAPIESRSMESLKSQYRYNAGSSMTARGASTAMNAVTGVVGKEALSPVQIDHLLRGYFGWLGSFVVGTADIVARPLTDQPTRPTPDLWKDATGGMVSELKGASSRYVTQMYAQAKEIEQAYGTWQSLEKQGKHAEAQQFVKENRTDLKMHDDLEAMKREEAQINERIRMIERSAYDPQKKRDLITPLQERKDRVARYAVAH